MADREVCIQQEARPSHHLRFRNGATTTTRLASPPLVATGLASHQIRPIIDLRFCRSKCSRVHARNHSRSSFFELKAATVAPASSSSLPWPLEFCRRLEVGHGHSSFQVSSSLWSWQLELCRSSRASASLRPLLLKFRRARPWPLQLPGVFKLMAVATSSSLAMAARVFEHHFLEVDLEDSDKEDATMGGSKLGDSVVGGAIAESRR